MSSSILPVAMGSSALHGSSIRSTSGSAAMARAMHRRCCWPPLMPKAHSRGERSFASSQIAAPRRLFSQTSMSVFLFRSPAMRRA